MPRPDAARAPYGDEHAVRAHACLMRVPTPAIVRRLLRFGIIGIMITLLHVIVAIGLIRAAHAAPALANAIAFAIATSASYIVNTFWSFSSGVTHQNVRRYLVVSLLGCAIASLVSGLADKLGQNYWIGILAVVAIVPALTFIAHQHWTYR